DGAEVGVDAIGGMAVEPGVGVGAYQFEHRARRIGLAHPVRHAGEKIEALLLRLDRLATRALAPIEHEADRLLELDRTRYELGHQMRIGGLLALERPGVERPHDVIGSDFPDDGTPRRPLGRARSRYRTIAVPGGKRR